MADAEEWRLRRAGAVDLDALHSLLSLPPVFRYLADGVPPSRRAAERWIEEGPSDCDASGFGLRLLEDGRTPCAGFVRLHPLAEPGTLGLTYALDPGFWGRGLATRMAWTAVASAFQIPGTARIIAGADRPNAASIAVIRRLGMRFLREVRYPLGPGVEYVLERGDPPPDPLPAQLPLP